MGCCRARRERQAEGVHTVEGGEVEVVGVDGGASSSRIALGVHGLSLGERDDRLDGMEWVRRVGRAVGAVKAGCIFGGGRKCVWVGERVGCWTGVAG